MLSPKKALCALCGLCVKLIALDRCDGARPLPQMRNVCKTVFAIDSAAADVVDSFCFRELQPRLAGP